MKKTLKQLTALVLALLLVFSMAACAQKETPASNTPAASSDGYTPRAVSYTHLTLPTIA